MSEIDLRTKALLEVRHPGTANTTYLPSLLMATPNRFAFFGKIRLKEWLEPDGSYWHIEGRLDFGGILL